MVTRLILLASILCLFQGCETPPTIKSMAVEIAGETYQLELAINLTDREHGLMNRTFLPDDGGMLFVFPDAQERSFWMKNCFIDVDLMFLDSRGTVMAVHRMVVEVPKGDNEPPWTYEARLKHYWSNGPSRFAIELSAGSLDHLQITVNDKISLDLPLLRRIAR